MPAYQFGPFAFDPHRHILLRGDTSVTVGQKALVLPETLLAAQGKAVGKAALMDAAWPEQHVEESNLAVQIAALRKVLGKTPEGQDWITTLPRLGYRIAADETPLAVPEGREQPQAAANRPSVAVLPFVNLSADPGQEYLSDGITEDIITELSRWRLLSVRSRSASFRYRGMAADLKQIAEDLKVRYVVEGSMRRMDKTIRISAQLIDAESGNHVWAEKYDRPADDVFEVQDQVVRTIVGTLVGRVQASAVERARRKPPASLAAYECVLQGNALPWDEPAGATEATRLFEQAIRIDPTYGFAYALLSNMRVRRWTDLPGEDRTLLYEAVDLATRGVQLDPNESTSHVTLGLAQLRLGNHDLALSHCQRAADINPTNPWNAADVGFVLVYCGRSEAALDCFAKARDIDPFFNPAWYWSMLGQALMILKRHGEALAALDNIMARGYWNAAHMAGCSARLGKTEMAATLAAECMAKHSRFTIWGRMTKEPFQNPDDADYLAQGMRLAGLPE